MNRIFVLAALLVALSSLSSCKDEKPKIEKEAIDAGAQATSIDATAYGVRVPLLQSWRMVGFTNEPGASAETIGSARRLPGDRPFVAAPRLVVTVEPTVMRDPEPVLRETLDELKSIGMRKGVVIVRTGLSTRPVRGTSLGDIEMIYTVTTKDGDPKTIVHRSVVALREKADGTRAIVTATATYLKEDRDLVGAEVQVMLDGVELFDPPRVDP